MRWATSLRLRLRSLARPGRVEAELTEELQYHLEHLIEDHIAAGMSPQHARYAALREMGATEQRKEDCRDQRRVGLIDNLQRDVRYALRTQAKAPVFTMVAVLSLAIGIGANTAIFSLWNGVLHSPLPAVQNAHELVILTNPEASGTWNGFLDGTRPWLTVEEYEQQRDQVKAFAGVIASQSSLASWPARVNGGPLEDVAGRTVSENYFEVLGVDPAFGRMFSTADRVDALPAVISYSFWQRRFGGRTDVLGKTISVRKATLTIVGVTARGFIGETTGQQPDAWSPMMAQPQVMGDNLLHDTPPEKSMWLHAMARLRPGVGLAQAEAESNGVFRAGLESFYSGAAPERRRVVMNQRLVLHAGSGGASPARGEFSTSLTALLAAVGVLLLIACANLANLLIARGSARQAEIAVRLSLGAGRGRIIQQLATESLVLSALGGVAAIFVAGAMHDVMVAMMARSDSRFRIDFAVDPIVLAFLAGATLIAAVIFGVLPAFQVTKTDAVTRLRDQGRTIGTFGQLRSSRFLVSLQLALSLPLLVGAGLLVRTVYNLQRADLGYSSDRLAIVRVDLREVADQMPRRTALLATLGDEIRRIPGVKAVTLSQLGLFSGGESSSSIAVDGFTAASDEDRDSAVDVVGPRYFSTLNAPITLGREIVDTDVAGATSVCVINESFAKRFASGRNPIGLHITRTAEEEKLPACEIVGVAKDIRSQDLREAIAPRFYPAAAQLPEEAGFPFFLIRADVDAAAIIPAVRATIARVDPAIPIRNPRTFEAQVAPLTAQDETIAQLAIIFAVVALALAAIGLYGVLSYGVVRRTPEIAVRIALGARRSRVIAMILGEITFVLSVGLLAGAGLAYAVSQLIDSRLYGVAPHDPATLAMAVLLLLAVSLAAALIPARRAAGLDPMVALRQQ